MAKTFLCGRLSACTNPMVVIRGLDSQLQGLWRLLICIIKGTCNKTWFTEVQNRNAEYNKYNLKL